jgi:hypothetical protein
MTSRQVEIVPSDHQPSARDLQNLPRLADRCISKPDEVADSNWQMAQFPLPKFITSLVRRGLWEASAGRSTRSMRTLEESPSRIRV